MKKDKTSDKTKDEGPTVYAPMPTTAEPCWSRHESLPIIRCEVTIDLDGPIFLAFAEVTEQEEHETTDLPALKHERLRAALLAVQAKALEYLNG